MLRASAHSPISGEVLEVGGPDVLSYGEMLERIAEAMLVGRPTLRLPVSMTGLAGRLAAAIAAEEPELVLPLMEGLQGDLLAARGPCRRTARRAAPQLRLGRRPRTGRMGARRAAWPPADEQSHCLDRDRRVPASGCGRSSWTRAASSGG